MWTSSDSKMPQSAGASTIQSPTASPADIPGAPAQVAYSAIKNQHSMIGKSIVIKGEITASDPVYIDGRVEGLINAPTQRVTIGREGKVKADISAREVVIMGEVCGNLDGGDRVEIRSNGSLTGDLAAHRVCIEDGAYLKGSIDIRKADKAEEPDPAFEPGEDGPEAEQDLEGRTWGSLAVSELG